MSCLHEATPFRKYLVNAIALSIPVMMILSGCGQGADTKLVEQLKTENESLKQELAELKGQSASSTSEAPSEQKKGESSVAVTSKFKDVDETIPTAEAIHQLASLNVFEGMGAEFQPTEPVTRAEYITWLFHAYNKMRPEEKQIRFAPAYKVPFKDISKDHPAYKYVQAMANAGYSVGYDDNTFRPDQPLTREEMIGIKQGVDGGTTYGDRNSGLNFSDFDKIDKKFVAAIYTDTVIKTNSGPKGNNVKRAFGPIKAFKPKEPVLRYEAAGTLWQTDSYGDITAEAALKAMAEGKTLSPRE